MRNQTLSKVALFAFLTGLLVILSGCSPVKTEVDNQYHISAYSSKRLGRGHGHKTILVSTPYASAGYQTNQMWYICKPFERNAFVKNSWVSPPSEMLYPLLVRSIQGSGYFYAVTSSPYSEGADYRLDTQLLQLEQSFLTKPSRLLFAAKVVLTNSKADKPVASRIFTISIPCTCDTPYGGVVAANKASLWFTSQVVSFLANHL